ncbi:GCN5-related N-acetyltransferase 5, chloroplastic isoform X2 [Cryptomeria japonica]|uniref:GCN5-related N-acetyltransferase 5, chloroplastic isoform X2 n=1 Tax=Cryptomeria japonica TaxID=3369 RepID=UPI0027D9E0B6|nr:GCN5-related N-acetyltransferase 5, chloroplastic isoform X2 [Cryptomeria japonica]
MNFLKIAPHPSARLAFTIISDCCRGFTSHAHSFALAGAKLKVNILKYGVLESNSRTRLHYNGCTNLDKNSPACIELGNGYALKEGIESTSEKNANKESFYDEVIRKVLSPSSLDPVKVKKDKGLLDDQELEKLESLENFVYEHRFDHGCLVIKAMDNEHMEDTSELLTESFAELMWGPLTYKPLLKFTIREHMMERRALVPHAVTLIEREGEWTFCGTVEISLNSKGASKFHTTPVPPKSSPYLFNMAVNKDIRRRGIGWQLLKASEKLVTQMGSGEMYLHCRMIDMAPFNMYTKAGYKVVETDNILTLLTLQRRKHLMYKKLALTS